MSNKDFPLRKIANFKVNFAILKSSKKYIEELFNAHISEVKKLNL